MKTAYRTTDPEVIKALRDWQEGCELVRLKRVALSDSMGRNLYVNRGDGFGSTRVVGFERFENDKDGELLAEGSLIVSSKRGPHRGLIVPNLRRKSGKAYAQHLREYTTPGLNLPGMPTFHVYCDDEGRTWVGGPTVFLAKKTMYALWNTDMAPVKENWVKIPLSKYYAAKEAFDAQSGE